MKIFELFSGTASFSTVATNRGHECRTLDSEPRFEPTYCMDIMDFDPAILGGWLPDVVWASPPCQCFSVMVIPKNWEKLPDETYRPKRPQTIEAMRIVERTLELIETLNPSVWVIENPRAMLRKMPFMAGLPRRTVTYCQYGTPYQKATDIWSNLGGNWHPKLPCSARRPCKVRAPKGNSYGLGGNLGGYRNYRRKSMHPYDIGGAKGWDSDIANQRGAVPESLCVEIVRACESFMRGDGCGDRKVGKEG